MESNPAADMVELGFPVREEGEYREGEVVFDFVLWVVFRRILAGGGRKGREERSTVVRCFFGQQWAEAVVGEEEGE
ncbi:hypothetical protein HAX54_009824, partial [Datura stramonium]|nr:hypothetical protein [Datura stramonium]